MMTKQQQQSNNEVVEVLQEELVVPAALTTPTSEEVVVETGRLLGSLLKTCNLDFIYIFQGTPNIEKLKLSLQQVLCAYPTMAGRLKADQKISLNNHGVGFRVQKHLEYTTIEDIPQDPIIGPPYCHIPSLMEQAQGKAPLLTVTVTLFQNDTGWTLGIVMNHVVADGYSFGMFMKDWSRVYNDNNNNKDLVISHLPVGFNDGSQDVDADAKTLGLVWSSSWIKTFLMKVMSRWLMPYLLPQKDARIGTKPERMILQFTKDQLLQIKAKAEKQSSTWISTNEAVMAHVWKLLMDATDLSPQQRSCVAAVVPVNLRGRVPGVSDRYVGNAISSVTVFADMSGKKEDTVPAEQIHNSLQAQVNPERLQVQHRFSNRMFDEKEPFAGYSESQIGDLAFGKIPGCMSWNWQAHHPYYEVDFETGPPMRGIPWCRANICTDVTVFPTAQGGGIDVCVQDVINWKKQHAGKTWSAISSLSMVLALMGSVVLLLLGAGSVLSSLLWFISFGLLAWGAASVANHEVAKAKQSIETYCRKHYADL